MRDEWIDLSDSELTARLTNRTDLSPWSIKGLVENRDDDHVAASIEYILNDGDR
jgi:hypothetical protein